MKSKEVKTPNILKLIAYIFGGLILLVNLFLAARHLFTGEIIFHTDIARDLLLMENLIENKKIELIGPRAGGIPGMFFGPIWYWITLPAMIIGNGNPLAIGIFWYILVLILILIVYLVSRNIFGKEVAYISAILMSFFSVTLAKGFTQSFGSLMLSPIIYYLLFKFWDSRNPRFFAAAIIVAGFTFHLQPAFAMLNLLTIFVFSTVFLFKIRKLKYLGYYLLLIIPFSTYIVFELRHDFIQIRSFFNFLISPPQDRQKYTLLEMVINRYEGFIYRLNLLGPTTWQPLLFITIHLYILFNAFKRKVKGWRFYLLFYSFYIAFWIFSLLFKGIVWEFYHWAFLPLVVIVFSSSYNLINKKLFLSILVVIFYFLFQANIGHVKYWDNAFANIDSSSWLLNAKVARFIYNDAGSSFGYYIFSPDEFGYSFRYAMNYTQELSPNIIGNFCQKNKITYLVYYPDSVKSSGNYWKENKVNLKVKPVEVNQFNSIKVEKYILDEDEVSISHDQNLLCSLIFR